MRKAKSIFQGKNEPVWVRPKLSQVDDVGLPSTSSMMCCRYVTPLQTVSMSGVVFIQVHLKQRF